ncbi:MAG: bifunctional N-acetylglucosamine-1-phosphate uridyltransferase/glucosamine-1-phosphate acetyltransferase, partial [Chloroflexi bacterium]|nr:bifunctional N-acetylglucosamine-1-phosphate uridyltransferase/glucosamine-1-phosphate acetyltransferase [Chloroflexota bacterium]
AQSEVNAGVYAASAAWLWPALERLTPGRVSGERYLTAVIADAVASGGAQSCQLTEPAEVQHVSTREDLARAERIMGERVRARLMASGVTLIDPATTYVDAGVSVGADTTLEPGVHLRGATVIGSRCRIGPSAVLRDVRVGDDCTIGGSTLEQCTLADGVTVGPYCHVRAGSVIDSGVYLGNYVEVKASRVGARTKVGHFSYLGDASVGSDVNIGAGVVTVNFDGKQKHATRIGDGAFIGSDSMLVAPIEIGERARTAAGSVVTHDVPAETLVVGAPARASGTQSKRADETERGS